MKNLLEIKIHPRDRNPDFINIMYQSNWIGQKIKWTHNIPSQSKPNIFYTPPWPNRSILYVSTLYIIIGTWYVIPEIITWLTCIKYILLRRIGLDRIHDIHNIPGQEKSYHITNVLYAVQINLRFPQLFHNRQCHSFLIKNGHLI